MSETSFIDEFLAGSLRALRASGNAPWSLASDTDWQAVWERIEFHGIPFLLHSKSHQLNGWPSDLTDHIAKEARLIILWETTHHKAVSELVEALAAAGIESVMMKGSALAYSLYDEPATRRRGDTDLLVHPKDKSKARAKLNELGWYRRDDPHGLYYQEGWLHDAANFFKHSVDLHWEPSDSPVLQRCLPIEDYFSNKIPMLRFGKSAFRPEPALMVLHATINQKWHAQHGYDTESGRLNSPRRLIWSVDLDLLIRSMDESDWNRLYALCESNNIGPLISESLRGMIEDLETPLPEDALARLEKLPLDPAVSAYLSNPDGLSQFWTDLRAARSFGEKRRLLLMRAFPPRDHLVAKYPSARGWPTAFLQGRLILETAQRAMRRAGHR